MYEDTMTKDQEIASLRADVAELTEKLRVNEMNFRNEQNRRLELEHDLRDAEKRSYDSIQKAYTEAFTMALRTVLENTR
jgi:hypothetical protein